MATRPVDEDRVLRTFLGLVAMGSPTGHEEEIGTLLEERFRGLGCATRRDDIGNLVAAQPGTRQGTLLVSTHMDTASIDRGIVPVGEDDDIIPTDGSTILGVDDRSVQRQRDPVRGLVDRHGRRARHERAHRDRRHGQGGAHPHCHRVAVACAGGEAMTTTPSRRLAPLVAMLVAAVVAGCGTAPSPTGLCDRYTELKTSLADARSAVPPSATVDRLQTQAEQLRQAAEKLKDALDRIQMMSDGRLDQAIGVARQQLDEIRAQLVVAKYHAAETLGPQLTQAQKDVQAAMAPVQNLLDSQCASG